jgi:hypothetical protein
MPSADITSSEPTMTAGVNPNAQAATNTSTL